PAKKPTSGGSSDNELNEPTDMPTLCGSPSAMKTVTPVGKWPRTCRKRAESKGGGAAVIGRRVPAGRSSADQPPSAVGDDQALVGGYDLLDTGAAGEGAGVLEDGVEGGAVVGGVVVEQRQQLDSR